jgi:hypothetical protein
MATMVLLLSYRVRLTDGWKVFFIVFVRLDRGIFALMDLGRRRA